jgi:tRNA (adenine22-N1)-methyltransferase
MVASPYTHIWDCCCDHGLLGAALLSRLPSSNVHFVDIVPELITELESKLERFYPHSRWQAHCLDVAKLPLESNEGNHLIIIAGVGGDLMIEFMNAIYHKHPTLTIEFLLCPVHHQFSLRKRLIELDFSLKNEVLVEDNKRFYEIIHVSTVADTVKKISLIGEKLWQYETAEQAEIAKRYLHKTLNHYLRIQQGNTNNVQHIIDAYNKVTLNLNK